MKKILFSCLALICFSFSSFAAGIPKSSIVLSKVQPTSAVVLKMIDDCDWTRVYYSYVRYNSRMHRDNPNAYTVVYGSQMQCL